MEDKAAKRSALVIAALMSFASPFMISAINVAMPAIQEEFSVNAVLLSWVATSYILATAAALVPVGKIADIYGRRVVYLSGISLFTVTSLLCAFAGSVEMLISIRIFQGIGAAMVVSTGFAIITSVFPVNERGRAIGINVAAVYIGLSSGPFLGGILTQYFTWKSIFLTGVPIGLASIALIYLFLKEEWADARGEKFDATGSLVYCVSLVLLMYGISELPGMFGLWFIIPGSTGLVFFVYHEMKIENPVFEVRLFTENRIFAFSCLASLINYAATFGVTFLLSLYLQYITGLSPRAAGFVLVAQPVVQALFSPFAGKLSDRVEPGIIASSGMGLTVIGLLLLVFIRPDTPISLIVFILILQGLGFALFSSPNMNAIMSSVEKRHYGIASGAVATMRTVGMTISMAIVTLIFSYCIGNAAITPEVYGEFIKSVKIALIVFTVLCTAGIYFSSARGRLR
jgi:EmrB/QacA subfamily drug resistance transporter